jgi:SAM-dependent methyltransferase
MDLQRYYDAEGQREFNQWEEVRFFETLKLILPGGNLLDVGCGEGYWLRHLSERTHLDLSGVDISPVKLRKAREILDGKANLSVADAVSLPYETRQFEQVTALEVLEHLPKWRKCLEELLRVSSKRIVISVPYRWKVVSDSCPNCGAEAFLDGHLYSFSEDNFSGLDNGSLSFRKIRASYGVRDYMRRALTKLLGTEPPKEHYQRQEGCELTVCPGCFEKFPHTRGMAKRLEKVVRLLKKIPDYLLIQIDKK